MFRVQKINSSRNTSEIEVLRTIAEFDNIDKAIDCYDDQSVGMEEDKQLIELDGNGDIIRTVLTTF